MFSLLIIFKPDIESSLYIFNCLITLVNPCISNLKVIDIQSKILPKEVDPPMNRSTHLSTETDDNSEITNIKGKMTRQLDKGNILNSDESKYLVDEIIPSTVKKLKPIYRLSSSNGFLASQFHKKCDGKKGTIFICETFEGRKFGGVNFLPWCSGENTLETGDNFIFSVDKKTVHRLKVNESGKHVGSRMTANAIDGDHSKGPIMGDGDLVISDGCHQSENCKSDLGEVYELDSEENGETYLAGKENFGLKAFYIYSMN